MIAAAALLLVAAAAIAAALATVRMLPGPTHADRIVALDIFLAAAIALAVAASLATGRTVFLDVAVGLALVGFVATVGWALLLERSPRVPPGRAAMIAWVGLLLVVAGGAALVIAAWGVLILPDALSRQHAATKAGTLALSTICLGAALLMMDTPWAWRLGLIVVFLLATLPVASHLLGRAAVKESGLEEAMPSSRRGARPLGS